MDPAHPTARSQRGPRRPALNAVTKPRQVDTRQHHHADERPNLGVSTCDGRWASTHAAPRDATEPAFGSIRPVLVSGFSWRAKAGWKVGECGVFRQVPGVAQHVRWNPVGEVLPLNPMCPGRCVLLTDRRQPVDREAVRDADQGTPDATVDERHLPIHQPRPDDIWRISEGVDRVEDRVTRWVTPPAPTDPFTGDELRHARQRSACRLEEHAVFDERRHRIHLPKSARRVRSACSVSSARRVAGPERAAASGGRSRSMRRLCGHAAAIEPASGGIEPRGVSRTLRAPTPSRAGPYLSCHHPADIGQDAEPVWLGHEAPWWAHMIKHDVIQARIQLRRLSVPSRHRSGCTEGMGTAHEVLASQIVHLQCLPVRSGHAAEVGLCHFDEDVTSLPVLPMSDAKLFAPSIRNCVAVDDDVTQPVYRAAKFVGR